MACFTSMKSILDALKVESKKTITKVASGTDDQTIEHNTVEFDIESVILFGDLYLLKKVNMRSFSDYKVGWVINNQIDRCMRCNLVFSLVRHKHHCRLCGYLVCSRCSSKKMQIDILLQAERLSRICSFCYDSNNLQATTAASSSNEEVDSSRPVESYAKNNMDAVITEEGSETSYINHDSDKQEAYAVDVTYGFFSRSYDPSLKHVRPTVKVEEEPTTVIISPFSDDNNGDNNNNNEGDDNNSVSSTQSFSASANSYSPINNSKVRVVKYSQVRDSSPNIIKEPDVSIQNHHHEVTQLRERLLALSSLSGANELLSDEDCLRFLKSKNYHVTKTTEMVKQWFEWWNRPLPGFTDVMPKNILNYVNERENIATDILLHANYGEDKEGHPIYWEKTGYVSSKFSILKTLLPEDEFLLRHVKQQELMLLRLKKASQKYKRSIQTQVIVQDLKNISMSIDLMALRLFRRTMESNSSYYPERLKVIYMINAPYTFTTIWSMVKSWLDPNTAKKIKIIGSNYLEVLKKDIDISQIPVEYGGTRPNFPWTVPDNMEK